MCTYLQAPTNGGFYKFRRRVPTELRPFIGKREWLISLKTKDRAEAKRRIPDLTKATDEALDEAREKLSATQTAETAESAPAASPAPAIGISREQFDYEEELAAWQAEESLAEEARREDPVRLAEFERIARISGTPTRDLPATDAAIRDFVRKWQDRAEVAEHRANMAEARERTAKRRTETQMAQATTETFPVGEPVKLEPLLEAYANEHGNRAKRGYASSVTHVRNLKAFLRADDARLITRANVVDWKDYLLRPVAEGGKGLSTKTVRDGYLATVRAVLGWAAMNGKIDANPANGLKVRVVAKPKTRERAFTDEEAIKVLAATFVPRPNLLPEYQLACRWAHWLMAYSGARVAEIGALRAEDIIQVDGVWVMNLTPDAGPKKDKKYRHVPLHSHLIDQGFVAVAQAKKTGPLFYNPEDWSAETKGGKGPWDKVAEKLRAPVREAGITAEMIEQPNHSWRHRFSTEGHRWELSDVAVERIKGHALATEGQKYGSWPASRLAKEIEKLPRFVVEASPVGSEPEA